VLKARASDKEVKSEFTKVLHVEQTRTGSRIVATDGKRMHVSEISAKIKSGNYKPEVTKDSVVFGKTLDAVSFPSWERVVPSGTRKRGTISLVKSGMGRNEEQVRRLSEAYRAFIRQTGAGINLRYLEDLPKKDWLVYSTGDTGTAIVLKEVGAEKESYAVFVPLAA